MPVTETTGIGMVSRKLTTGDLLQHIVQRSGKLKVCILMLHLSP